jgi:soluble lytic murein transglycosylase-like protein
MTTSPILRSAALQKSLALAPVRRFAASPGTFAATLAQAQSRPAAQSSVLAAWGAAASSAARSASHSPVEISSRPRRVVEAVGASTENVDSVPFHDEITMAANKYGVDPALLAGLVKQESNFNPSARSGAGAKGLTQLMDATARGLGVTDPFDPAQSLDAGAKFLGGLLKQFHGDPSLALAAYNAGPVAVQKYGGIPPYQETQRYVPKVLGYAAQFRRIWANS